MSATAIEWTDATWNPTVGCTWASPGCDHCYAATMARRLEAMGKPDYAGLTTKKHFNGLVRTLDHKLDAPLRWKKPRMVFVNSMSDLFHKDVPFEFIDRVFGVMAKAYWHTFQVLTKRPNRMAEYLADNRGPNNVIVRTTEAAQKHPWPKWKYDEINAGGGWNGWPYSNVWLGTSIENQEAADERWEPMNATGEAGWTTFVSYEPALGPVDWAAWSSLRWLISGGESGHHARPSHPDWHRMARDYCQKHGIAYFFKQWGEWLPGSQWNRETLTGKLHEWSDEFACRCGKVAAGRLLDGREWSEFPKESED